MASHTEIKRSVLQMYMAHPYPQWTREERRARLASELCRYRFLGLADAMRGARFLDVGCGTANRCMLPAKHLGVREYVGVDHSTASLAIARRVAEEEAFDRFVPVEGDVFSIPYPDESFDVVMCQGVLHHTADPFRGLREVVRVCRRGGLVSIFLYNRWNHWRHNLQKDRVTRLAGDDIEERFRVAHRLYGSKPLNRMSPEEIATFYDQYCHPHKSDHTIGETLSWFDRVGLTYWGSYPPLRIRDFVACAQERARLLSEYPLLFSDAGRLTTTIARRLPAAAIAPPPFRRPTLIHRFFWQAVYAWHGRHGAYSGGAMLCGLRR